MKTKLLFLATILAAMGGSLSAQNQNTARMLSGTNVITSCPYTIQATDQTKLLVLNTSTPCTFSLPAATTANFGAGAIFSVVNQGASPATIAPASGTINGAASLALTTGQGVDIYSDGANYQIQPGSGTGGGGGTPAGSTNDAQCNFGGIFSNCSSSYIREPDTIYKGPNPSIDIRAFNARAVTPGVAPQIPGVSATCSNGSPTVTLSSASTFQNGDYVAVWNCGTLTVNTPSAPTITPITAGGPTMSQLTASAPTGSTQYCYQILARSFLGGTSVSPEACTTTGPATLGVQSVSISSVSLSNNIATFTTSSAHGIQAGTYVRVTGAFSTDYNGGQSFNGWFLVNTAADNTHFTVALPFDSRTGGPVASNNNGTVYWYNGIKIAATASTNNYEYYVYGRATGTGKALIGIMQPQPFGTTCSSLFTFGDNGTCLTFDDLGAGGVLTATPTAPTYIPAIVPGAGQTRDMLLAQIIGGAGTTTLTLSANASTNNTSVILFDDAQALLAAWNNSASTQGAITIPASPSGTQWIFNAPIQIINQGGQRPIIQQAGNMQINEPIVFTTFTKWVGIPGGGQSASGFSQQVQPTITVRNASPGLYVAGSNSMVMENVNITGGGAASQISFLQDGGGIPTSRFQNVTFNIGSGHSNIAAMFRGGGADLQFVGTAALGSQNGSYADSTPVMVFNQLANTKFDWLYMSGGGILTIPNLQGASGYFVAKDVYCQACYQPFFSFAKGASGAAIFGSLQNVTNDTGFDNIVVSNFGGNPLTLEGNGGALNPSNSSSTGDSGGNQTYDLDNTGNGFPIINQSIPSGVENRGESQLMKDGTLGTVKLPIDSFARRVRLFPGYGLYSDAGSYAAPTCSASAGGSLATGTYLINYAPIFSATGDEGHFSQTCAVTLTTGNQTITASAPASVPGVVTSGYDWYYLAPSSSYVQCLAATTISVSISSAGSCTGAAAPYIPAGGPAGIKNSELYGQSLYLGLSNITSNATAVRNLAIPDTGGTVAAFASAPTSGSLTCTSGTGGIITTSGCPSGGALPAGSTNATQYNAGSSLFGGNGPGLSGQVWISNGAGSAPNMTSPGVPDGNAGSAINSTPYTIQCDSGTSLVDRAHILRFQFGAAAVTVPQSSASGCTGNFVTTVVDDGAGTLTFSRTGSDTFSVFDGSSNVDGATSFTLLNGQHAVLTQGTGTTWEVRKVIGNGVGATANFASPATAVYISPQCPSTNAGQCFNTPGDTQQSQACSWTSGSSATVTCGSQLILASGAVASNVATYTFNSINAVMIVPSNWAIGNSVTVTGFIGGDTYLNQTCTLTAVTTNSVSCALTHANASSSVSVGVVTNTSVGPFVSTDVGKQVAGWTYCGAFATSTLMGANAISTTGAPTITAYTSATQVTISTAANAQSTQVGCFIWGHPDDTAIAAAEAAWVQFPFCPKIEIAASNYMITQPHFYNQPAACGQEGTINPFSAGNVFYSGGMEVEGRGTGNTVLYIMPNFPNGDTCTRGIDGASCFFIPLMGKWVDFQLTGGSQAQPPNMTGTHSLISCQVCTLENMTLTNYGAFAHGGPVINGVTLGWQAQIYQVQNSGWGNVAMNILSGEGYVTAIRASFENSLLAGLNVGGPAGLPGNGYSFTCYDCRFFNSQNNNITGGGNAGNDIINRGGSISLINTVVKDGGQTFLGGQEGYLCNTTSGCTLTAINTDFYFNATTTNNAIVCSVSCSNTLQHDNIIVNANPTSKSYTDVAGSILYDLGSNGLSPVNFSPILGTIIADGRSIRGYCTGTATSSTTLTLRTSGVGTGGAGIPSTCTGTTLDAGIPMTQARTASTLLVTATHAGVSASSGVVTLLKNGVGTAVTCTIGTGTSCSDVAHFASFSAGDTIGFSFTTQATEVLAGVQAQIIWQ